MAGNFISMVYAVLKDKGVNTKDMTADEAVEKYNELVGKTGRYNVGSGEKEKQKREELRNIYDSERRWREMPKAKNKMTPAEKIASVHIDFSKDNILPELNEEDLEKIGSKVNKPVLLKKGIIDRNNEEHADLTNSDFESIVSNALYSPSEIFKANKSKPYYHFAKIIQDTSKGKPEYGLVLLDVDEKKDSFEIVHIHYARQRSYESMKNKQ